MWPRDGGARGVDLAAGRWPFGVGGGIALFNCVPQIKGRYQEQVSREI